MGKTVTQTVALCDRGSVRLGVEALPTVPLLREEVYNTFRVPACYPGAR